MNKITFTCYCKNPCTENKQQLNYDVYNFQYFKLFDGNKHLIFTDCKKLLEYFDTVDVLICIKGYFDIGMLFNQLEKCKLDQYQISRIATCNLSDLYAILGQEIPANLTLKYAFNEYLRLTPQLPASEPYNEFKNCWITVGERKYSENSGKWVIFANRAVIGTYWHSIKNHYKSLGIDCVRVSTMAVNIWGGSARIAVIMGFMRTTPSKKELLRIGKLIDQLFPSAISIAYKTDAQSKMGNSITGKINNSFIKIK